MKKLLIYANLLGSMAIFLMSIHFSDMVVRFITVGQLPWASSDVSPDVMLMVYFAVAILIFTRPTMRIALYIFTRFKPVMRPKFHFRLPKRRFNQV